MKSHQEVIEESEEKLIEMLLKFNPANVSHVFHPDLIYVNEKGEIFRGTDSLHLNNPELLLFKDLKIIDRTIDIFNNVAIVNSTEERTGRFQGLDFEATYRLMRVWKFTKSKWLLIAASATTIGCEN